MLIRSFLLGVQMKRKIVQHGSSSLTVSLPFSWAQKHDLNKGDEVEVEEKGHSLMIHSKNKPALSKVKFTIDDKNKFLRRYIISLYKQGYDEIEIHSEDGMPMDKIEDVLNEVLGFEIVEQTAKRCVIKNVAQAVDDEFDTMLRRAFLITISMANEALNALENREFVRLKDISRMQYTTNKLTNLCQRILNKKGHKDHTKTNYMYSMIDQLEQVGDHLGDMCDYFVKNRVVIGTKALDSFRKINSLLEYTHHTFYNFHNDKMVELKKRTKELNNSVMLTFENISGKQLVLVQYLFQILERINHLGLFMIDI
jgi:phosphate uptake regulator